MALLYLKQLLTTRERRRPRYSPIPSNTYYKGDVESIASDDSLNEKFCTDNEPIKTARVKSRIISDATIGLSDGLTVPFALTAGLSALGDNNVVIYGGLAELIAGGISMGLGGYLGAKSEAEAYDAALGETEWLVSADTERAVKMVQSAFEMYDFPEQTLNCITSSLLAEPTQMVEFLMRFHHRLAETDHTASKAYESGLTISLGYFFGGLVPLVPYVFLTSMHQALMASIVVMAIALFTFGWVKTALIGDACRWTCFKNGLQMMTLGGVAAGAAMACVKAVGS